MKRVIVCLLACMLLISGMLVYVSAENFAPVDPDIIFDFDWDFQYDDSKMVHLLIFRMRWIRESSYSAK